MQKVVVIGGGTGTFTVLSGLKKYPLDLTALVAMADDGGSTGVLRDELGVLPAGDIRQAIVALSEEDKLMRELMGYRFTKGSFKGHSFGNLFLAALEKVTGSFEKAVEKASEVLRIEGQVLPMTLDKIRLVIEQKNGKKIVGEGIIYTSKLPKNIKKIYLRPKAKANPRALRAIHDADMILLGPGDIYSSLIPNLLVGGIGEAIKNSKAKKVYVCNLMTKWGQTDDYTVYDFLNKVKEFLPKSFEFDYVVYNNKKPSGWLLSRYAREKEHLVPTAIKESKIPYKEKFVGGSLVNQKIEAMRQPEMLKRNLIRHDPAALAKLIMKLLG